MNDLVLVTRPDHDDTTFYLFQWCEEAIEIAEAEGKKIIDLKRKRANRKAVENVLRKKEPSIVLLHGHGNESTVCGDKDEVILDLKNVSLLNSKIIHTLACRSAKILGYHSVKNESARAFIGYSRDFTFPFDSRETAHPKRDDVCQPVLESSFVVGTSLVRGKTPRESYRASQYVYEQWIKTLIRSKEPEAPYILKHLLWNKSNQILFENTMMQ